VVEFRQPIRGNEGHFTATARARGLGTDR
jgi:hypothetical protein